MFCILIPTSALTPFILGKSRMRKRARTDLCGGRSAMAVPTATVIRVVTVVISVAIFACSIHPTLHSPWLRSNITRRIVLCFVAVGIAAYGWILWPYSLNVSPTNVRFENRGAAGQTYSFRFTNRSDKDLYASQLKFSYPQSGAVRQGFPDKYPDCKS